MPSFLIALVLTSLFFTIGIAYAAGEDAYVYRYRNLQGFEMIPQVHPPGNASVYRYRNLQGFEMIPTPPGNASVYRYRNLQGFEMIPTGPLSVSIDSFTTTDQNGEPKDTFAPGSLVLFKIVVSGDGSQNIPNALVSVMVQDPAKEVVFISYTFEDVQVGQQTTVYLGTQIPYDSMLGEHTAKVNIFTMLPSEGGEAIIGGHEEITFIVG